jgi:hypothetical protein
MRETTAFEKLATSTFNVMFVSILFTPFNFFVDSIFAKKILLVFIFFIHNLTFLFLNKRRLFGMIVMKTTYAKRYSTAQLLSYASLYSLSFSSLLFWIFFPLDIFLFNMLLLQLPTVILKKTTLHGYLSGNITSVKLN